MNLAKHLKAWRGVTGRGRRVRGQFSQADAARILGVPVRTYESWEHGRHQPVGLALAFVIEKTGRPSVSMKKKPKGTRPARRTGKAR